MTVTLPRYFHSLVFIACIIKLTYSERIHYIIIGCMAPGVWLIDPLFMESMAEKRSYMESVINGITSFDVQV